jgi:hypothetical protein
MSFCYIATDNDVVVEIQEEPATLSTPTKTWFQRQKRKAITEPCGSDSSSDSSSSSTPPSSSTSSSISTPVQDLPTYSFSSASSSSTTHLYKGGSVSCKHQGEPIEDHIIGCFICIDCGLHLEPVYDSRSVRSDCSEGSFEEGGGRTMLRPDAIQSRVVMSVLENGDLPTNIQAEGEGKGEGEKQGEREEEDKKKGSGEDSNVVERGGGVLSSSSSLSTPSSTLRVINTPVLGSTMRGGRGGVVLGQISRRLCRSTDGDASVVNAYTMNHFKALVDGVLGRLLLSERGDIRNRIHFLGQAFLQVEAATDTQVKSASNLAVACINRALAEHQLGYKRDEIRSLFDVDFKITRQASWNGRLRSVLHLPKLDRGRLLDGFINRFMAGIAMTVTEQEKVYALASWVKFIMWMGAFLPPLVPGGCGAPYTSYGSTIPWASQLLRPSDQREKEHKKKKSKRQSTRTGEWLVPLCISGRLIVADHKNDDAVQLVEWKKLLISKEAIKIVVDSKSLPPLHLEPKWPLNGATVASIAMAILWLVGQMRTTVPKQGQIRPEPNPVKVTGRSHSSTTTTAATLVLNRPTQKSTCTIFNASRQSLANVKHAMRDMYYCFM